MNGRTWMVNGASWFLVLVLFGCGGLPIPAPAKSHPEILSLLDGGGYVQTARFRSLLSQLTAKFVESEKEISDMTVKAQELMKKDGVEESLLSIMEGMNQIFSAKVANQEYKQYVSAYITLRGQGQSHDQAVSGLRALVGSLR